MFKTFDELDREAGPEAMFANPAAPQPKTPVGYDTPETLAKAQEISNRSTWGAAFRQDNTIGAMLTRRDLGVDNEDDPTFNVVDYIKQNKLEGHESSFYGVLNGRLADAKRDQIKTEEQDKETLGASGWLGTLAGVGAGLFDLPSLIPGTVAVRSAAGGYSVARSALMAGVSAVATQTVTEGAMHATQETRTGSESVVNIGGAFVLGSLLGGGTAALLSRSERRTGIKAIDNLSDINTGKISNELPEGAPGSAGAAANPFTDEDFLVPRTRAETALEGRAVNAIAAKSSWSPALRGTQALSPAARQLYGELYSLPLYRTLNSAGESLGPSAETLMESRLAGLMGGATKATEEAYVAMRKAPDGARLGRKEFAEQIGLAMKNNDQHENPFVAQAATAHRKVVVDLTDEAIREGKRLQSAGVEDSKNPFSALLKEDALDVKTAPSYMTRVPNRNQLLMDEAKFLDVIGDEHYLPAMQRSFDEDAARLEFQEAKRRQIIDDLSQTGAARGQRLEDIKRAGEVHDARNGQHVDRASDISDLAGTRRSKTATAEEKEAARAEIKRLTDEGGPEFQGYLTTREELRRRERNLTERNPDAQAERGERLTRRIDDLEATAERSTDTYGRQAKNLLNKIASDPAGRADELVAVTERQVTRLRAGVAQAEQRANEFKAQYLEQMDPKAGFDAAAARATREGATGEAAIRAGTKEADRIAKQIADAERAVKDLSSRADRLEALNERLRKRETAREAAQDLAAEFEQNLKDAAKRQTARALRRGEERAVLKERAAALSPDEVKKRGEAQVERANKAKEQAERTFASRWGEEAYTRVVAGETHDLRPAARDTAQQIYNSYTGRGHDVRPELPAFISPIARGPMKERLVMVPDALFDAHGWMNNDVREVTHRFARKMAGEIALSRKVGHLEDRLATISKEYSDMQVAVDRATSVQEINDAAGTSFSPRKSLEKAKQDAKEVLNDNRQLSFQDLRAAPDRIRGTYKMEENNTNFATISRLALHASYQAKSGGFALPNISDLYRAAMVHGLRPFMEHMPSMMAQAFGKGGPATKALIEEGRLTGLIYSRWNSVNAMSMGDVADPLIGKVTAIERLMQKGSALASRFNLMDYMNDGAQAYGAVMSQHRIIEAITGHGGRPGSALKNQAEADRYLGMLGINSRMKAEIAGYIERHSENYDGVRVPNTEQWLAEARVTGSAREIDKAENAVRYYRSAMSLDVHSIVSKKKLGDTPLMGDTPMGRLMLQFAGYTLGAHSGVMLRGMQEDKARFVGGLVAMSSIGALTAYLTAWRGGQERWEKFNREIAENPYKLFATAVDRSSLFPILFDVSNRIEKASGGFGEDYRINPVQALLSLPGGRSAVGATSTRGTDAMGAFGAVLGPTVSMVEGAYAGGRLVADKLSGKQTPKREFNRAVSVLPGSAHIGMREALQVLNGNSPWVRR